MKALTREDQGCVGILLVGVWLVLILTALTQSFPLGHQVSQEAKSGAARTQILAFREPLERYTADNGRPPSTEQGLAALIRRTGTAPLPRKWHGPYLTDIPSIPKDAWGNDYLYESPGPHGEPFVITSLGRDGKPGGEEFDADISSVDPLPVSANVK